METLIKERKKQKHNNVVFEIISVTVLGIYAFSLLFMLAWALVTSVKNIIDFTLEPMAFFVKDIRLINYVSAFREMHVKISTVGGDRTVEFVELLFNSLFYVAGCCIVSTYTHVTCAYVAAKYPRFITKLMYSIVLFLMSFTMLSNLSSEIVLLKGTYIYNNRILYFLYCGGFTGSNYLIFYSAFKGVSSTYSEAARMDGAGHYRIMFTIMMPMIKSVITGMMLLQIIGLWNDWYVPMVWLPSYPTISYALYRFQFNTENSVSSVPVQVAGSIVVALPTLAIFIAFKNKFIGNIAIGGLKG